MKTLLKELLLKLILGHKSVSGKLTSIVTATTDTRVVVPAGGDVHGLARPSNVSADAWLCIPIYSRPSSTWGCVPKLLYFNIGSNYQFGVHNLGGTTDTVIITWLVCPASAIVGGVVHRLLNTLQSLSFKGVMA